MCVNTADGLYRSFGDLEGWYVFNGRPARRRETMSVTGHESGEMSLPVDSSHKAALPSLPLESTYCDREINMSFTYTL